MTTLRSTPSDIFSCSFSYTAITLGSIYILLLIAILRYLYILYKNRENGKRYAQKIFLSLVAVQCAIRAVFFILWPFLGSVCSPSFESHKSEWIDLFGNLPAALFLLAFSVLVFTFARIYHRVLLIGISSHRHRFHALTISLVILNVAVFISEIAEWLTAENSPLHSVFSHMLMWMSIAASFILGIAFFTYGTLLYFQVEVVMSKSGAVAHVHQYIPPHERRTITPNHHHHLPPSSSTTVTIQPVMASYQRLDAPIIIPPSPILHGIITSSDQQQQQQQHLLQQPHTASSDSFPSIDRSLPASFVDESMSSSYTDESPSDPALLISPTGPIIPRTSRTSLIISTSRRKQPDGTYEDRCSGHSISPDHVETGEYLGRQILHRQTSSTHHVVTTATNQIHSTTHRVGSLNDESTAPIHISSSHQSHTHIRAQAQSPPRGPRSSASPSHPYHLAGSSSHPYHLTGSDSTVPPWHPASSPSPSSSNTSATTSTTRRVTTRPPNPMRKIAIIAGICTVCLLIRTALIPVIQTAGDDYTWVTTLVYFTLSEIIPLLLMLRVLEAPTSSPVSGPPHVSTAVVGTGTGTGTGTGGHAAVHLTPRTSVVTAQPRPVSVSVSVQARPFPSVAILIQPEGTTPEPELLKSPLLGLPRQGEPDSPRVAGKPNLYPVI